MRQPRQHLFHDRNGILTVELFVRDKRSEASTRNIFHDEVRRVCVRVEPASMNNIAMIQPMNGRSFALKIADVLAIRGNLDRDELIGPHVMTRAPDLSERATTDSLFQDVFADSLIGRRHVDSYITR